MPKNMQPRSRLIRRPGSPNWYAEIRVGDPQTKKRIRKVLSTNETVKSKAESIIQDMIADLLEELYTAHIQVSDRQPIGDFFAEYEQGKLRQLRPATQKDYLFYISRFERDFDRTAPLCSITRASCLQWLNTIDRLPARAKTCRTLRSVFQEAVMTGRLSTNPFANIRTPKPSRRTADYFDDDRQEFVRFWEEMPESSYRLRTIKNMTYLAQATGMRSGEVAHLQLTHIDWQRGTIRVTNSEGFDTKNGRERYLLISPQVEEALTPQLKNKAQHKREPVRESAYLFPNERGTPYSANDISNNFREVREILLPGRTGLHYHSLRHSFAQNASNNSVPITQIAQALGDGIGVTEQTYAPMDRHHQSEGSYRTLREYLLSRPKLTRQPPATIEAHESPEREPIQGVVRITELECSEASA